MSDTRKSDAVIRLCRAAIELDPDYARAWALMASAQRYAPVQPPGEGDNGAVAAATGAGTRRQPGRGTRRQVRHAGTRRRLRRGRAEIAIALRLDPESIDVLREAGRLASTSAGTEDAMRHWESASRRCMETDYRLGRAADHLLHRARRHRQAVRRVGAAHARPCREGRGARRRQRLGHGRDRSAACSTLGENERAREWAQPRNADRSRTTSSMRYNLACDAVVCVQRLRPRAGTARAGHALDGSRAAELAEGRRGPRSPARGSPLPGDGRRRRTAHRDGQQLRQERLKPSPVVAGRKP